MKALKTILKIVSSARLMEILDKNKDGKISVSEIRSATLSDWLEIAAELGISVLSILYFTK